MAMDAIATTVRDNIHKKGDKTVSFAYLATPTDIYLRPRPAREAAINSWNSRPLWMKIPIVSQIACNVTGPEVCSGLTRGSETGYDVVDSTVHQQGPNYLLAKRLQHWRAMSARAQGTAVSSNVAPASFTVSVTKASLLAAAFEGVQSFPPIEIFAPDTSCHVMTAALLYDIFFPQSAAHPDTDLANPSCLWSENSWHGGMWRVAVKIRTCVVPAALIGLSQQYVVPIKVVLSAGLLATAVFTTHAFNYSLNTKARL